MIKIGVPGSIASGKTTVARILSGTKYPLFDADKEVNKIYQQESFKRKNAVAQNAVDFNFR